MKTSLRERMEAMLDRMVKRRIQLEKHIAEYVEAGNYLDASINKVKLGVLKMVEEDLRKELDS